MVEWSGQPAYKQVANALREKIKAEGLEPGTKLGSLADLMTEHDVSITVVRMALKDLKDAGLVSSHPGKGNFVAGGPDDKNHRFQQAMQQLGAIRQHSEQMAEQMAALEGRLADLESRVDALTEPSAPPGRPTARRGQR